MRNPYTISSVLRQTKHLTPSEVGVYARLMDFLKQKKTLPPTKREIYRICGIDFNNGSRYDSVIRMAEEVNDNWNRLQGVLRERVLTPRVLTESSLKISESKESEEQNPAKLSRKLENPLYLSNNILLDIDNKQNQTKSELKHEELPLLRPSEMLAAAPSKVEAIMKNHGVPPSVREEEFRKFDLHYEGKFVKDANHAVNLWNYWCTNYRNKAMAANGQKKSNSAPELGVEVKFTPRGRTTTELESKGVRL